MRNGHVVEAGSLKTLVDAALRRAWRGDSALHGEDHSRRVTATGLALGCTTPDVDRTLVFCFGLLHDTRRENEAIDPGHGPRAAAFAGELREEGVLPLEDDRFVSLADALRRHSSGEISGDPTIGTCWDADRLHLPRVSIEPDPAFLSTAAALGVGPLASAAALRAQGAPSWDWLVALVSQA